MRTRVLVSRVLFFVNPGPCKNPGMKSAWLWLPLPARPQLFSRGQPRPAGFAYPGAGIRWSELCNWQPSNIRLPFDYAVAILDFPVGSWKWQICSHTEGKLREATAVLNYLRENDDNYSERSGCHPYKCSPRMNVVGHQSQKHYTNTEGTQCATKGPPFRCHELHWIDCIYTEKSCINGPELIECTPKPVVNFKDLPEKLAPQMNLAPM